MPVDTLGKKFEEAWVAYVYFKPACSVMDPETHWDKFGTEVEAIKRLEEWKLDPRFIKADEVRKYKVYQLERLK